MTDMKFGKVAPLQHSDLVYVRRIRGKGRGVFAKRPIKAWDVIEKVPVVVIPTCCFADGLANPFLQKYCYIWTRSSVALTLGFGSLYNHSYEPNADYWKGEDGVMIYKAIRDIDPGEEITVNYNGDPGDKSPVVFPDVSAVSPRPPVAKRRSPAEPARRGRAPGRSPAT